MHFLKYYNENIVKYDLINKFRYQNVTDLPELKSVSIRFQCEKYEMKNLIAALAALKLITSQKAFILVSKTANISLKIRKGHPVGCKIILRKTKMNEFFVKFINKLTFSTIKTSNFGTFSFKIQNIFVFDVLEKNYQFFNKLKNLNIDITTSASNHKECAFLLKSFKIKTCN